MIPAPSSKAWTAIPVATLVAGTLDILYAIIVNGVRGVSAIAVLQSVASGVLGRAAYAGGTRTAALGLVIHYLIMLGMVGVFFIAAKVLPILRHKPVIAGLLYGLVLYAMMTWIIVPLSAFPGSLGSTGLLILGNVFAHTVLVGLPIAILARCAMPPVSNTGA